MKRGEGVLHATFRENKQTFRASFGSMTVAVKTSYLIGNGLKYDAALNTLSVDAADSIKAGDARPITSAAVSTEIGNIEALLHTI